MTAFACALGAGDFRIWITSGSVRLPAATEEAWPKKPTTQTEEAREAARPEEVGADVWTGNPKAKEKLNLMAGVGDKTLVYLPMSQHLSRFGQLSNPRGPRVNAGSVMATEHKACSTISILELIPKLGKAHSSEFQDWATTPTAHMSKIGLRNKTAPSAARP